MSVFVLQGMMDVPRGLLLECKASRATLVGGPSARTQSIMVEAVTDRLSLRTWALDVGLGLPNSTKLPD